MQSIIQKKTAENSHKVREFVQTGAWEACVLPLDHTRNPLLLLLFFVYLISQCVVLYQ
jgi:hypothetical protein